METLLLTNVVLLWIVFLFLFILLLAVIRKLNKLSSNGPSIANTESSLLQIGEQLPQVEFQPLNISNDTLQSDQQTAMVFIKPDCKPCREKVNELNTVHRIVRRIGIDFMVVSLGNANNTQVFIDEAGLTAPVYIAPGDEDIQTKLKIAGTPMYYLTDNGGLITKAGFLDLTWNNQIAEWVTAASE